MAPQIEVVLGDITEQDVDAVVNAANRFLLGGGGVDGAIHARGGPTILEACRELRAEEYPDGLPTGEAVFTTAGDLPARWVIHTVGPVFPQADDPEALLRRAHVSSLEVADAIGAASVAFPAISCGAYGYPPAEAAPVAVDAVLHSGTAVPVVRFVLFTPATYDVFSAAVAAATA